MVNLRWNWVGFWMVSVWILPSVVYGRPLPGYDAFDAEAKIQADRELLSTVTYVGNNKVYGLLSNKPPPMREAKLDQEHLDSSILTKLDNVQKSFVDKGNLPAVVDQTARRDYFTNDLKLAPISKGVVDIFEQLSNIFNNFAEKIPKGTVKSLSKGTLNSLNKVGAVLVGLEDA
ncbi:uncharacterized protein LOC126577112 [Anopheles aquasalis]|uniref:uncharacterized protein LOC126577112 n=1 Tax=Anopheles aquasalis TaxID=42839 RepID=UPI00215AF05F|nr:uncharacterized protein LOC126577112 [Anopheles aquasalis]